MPGDVHEEYLTGFRPAMSRLFDISWTEQSFLMVFAFIWFIFIGAGVADFTHFIFPLIRPSIAPEVPGVISRVVSNGGFVAHMRNDYVRTTGTYYFPGLYTAILPMIPGIWAIRRMLRTSASVRKG